MTSRVAVIVAAGVAVGAVGRPSRADPCLSDRRAPPRPLQLGLGPADFATTPTPCPSTSAALSGRAAALVDEPDFYGTLGADLVASGAWAPWESFFFSASFAALEYREVHNATIVATSTDLGPATLAGHLAHLEEDRLRVSSFLRLLLPTGSVHAHATEIGFEPGASALVRLGARTSATFGISTPVTATLLGGRGLWRGGPRLSADASFAPWRWLESAFGMEARFGSDPEGPLEYVAPGIALRLHPWRGLQAEAAAMAPLVGVERTDLRLAVGAGWWW